MSLERGEGGHENQRDVKGLLIYEKAVGRFPVFTQALAVVAGNAQEGASLESVLFEKPAQPRQSTSGCFDLRSSDKR